MVYYVATADITRDDVHLFANYNNNDPAGGWAMQRVLDQANAAQAKYGDPESEQYIPNYNVIVSTNGAGFNMSTGEPGGLLVMGGVEYHPIDSAGFFGILKDGTAMIGTRADYETYKDQIQEAIGGFGEFVVMDGKVTGNLIGRYSLDRAYYSEYTREAFETPVGSVSGVILVDGIEDGYSDGYYLVYKLEKSEEHLADCYDEIAEAYVSNAIGARLNANAGSLYSSLVLTDNYSLITHSEIRMGE
jgi:hypothetical protein